MLKTMLVNSDFLTWLLIGGRRCGQPIRCQVWKSNTGFEHGNLIIIYGLCHNDTWLFLSTAWYILWQRMCFWFVAKPLLDDSLYVQYHGYIFDMMLITQISSKYSTLSISQVFFAKNSEGTPQGSPERARCGVSFLSEFLVLVKFRFLHFRAVFNIM